MYKPYKLHEKGVDTTLLPDRKTARGTGGLGFVFSDIPLVDGITFTCKLSGLSPWANMCGHLPAYLGVNTQDPASLPDPPDWSSVQSGSSLVYGDGSLSKAGRPVGQSDMRLDRRDPTEVGVRWVDGEVRLYQDGVYKGVMDTGLKGPVWPVVCHWGCNTFSVIYKETMTIAPEPMPAPVTYKMDTRPLGYAVFVNMTQVLGHPDRLGSEHDVTRLTELFQKLHFKVKTFTNQSAQDIHDELKGISKRPAMKSQDAFVLVLMSHGGPGYILGADGNKVDLEKTFWLFSNNGCPALRKKPKLFFIQSNNGVQVDNGNQDEDAFGALNAAGLPEFGDLLVAKASLKGYVSWRDINSGSRFIQSLVDEFEEHAALLDVGRMMTRVLSRVHRKATCVTQCPVVKTTLTKDLYLKP